MKTTSESPSPRVSYDWRGDLGEVPLENAPGQTQSTHVLTRALAIRKTRPHAVEVLRKAVTECEGRLDRLAGLLGCSWHVAGRLVDRAGLRELAGTLRLEHGHPGPTGHGIQRKRRSAAA